MSPNNIFFIEFLLNKEYYLSHKLLTTVLEFEIM